MAGSAGKQLILDMPDNEAMHSRNGNRHNL